MRANANVVLTNPEMLHVGLLPHHAGGPPSSCACATSSSTSSTPCGASSAATSPTCCAACAGSAPTTARRPRSSSPRPPSASPAGWPRSCAASRSRRSPTTAHPRGERVVRALEPRGATTSRAGPAPPRRPATPPSSSSALIDAGHRTIAFCRSRKGTELVAGRRAAAAPGRPRRHRAPLPRRLPRRRAPRDRERSCSAGSLRGVVATTALELGIDIGGLDACVLNGFPGTIASMWQQVGRAGRDTQASIAVLVAGDDQLDQWFMHHPDELFARPPEPAVINPDQPPRAAPAPGVRGLRAAPRPPLDDRWWPDQLDDGVRRAGARRRPQAAPPHHRRGPAGGVGRPGLAVARRRPAQRRRATSSASPPPTARSIGTVDESRAFRLVHPGAVYLHQGRSWRVASLDLDDRVALVEPADGGEYTQPRTDHRDRRARHRRRSARSAPPAWRSARCEVRSQVIGYRRFDAFTGEQLGLHDLDLPPGDLVTRAFWYVVPDEVLADAGVGHAAAARCAARRRARRHRHPAAVHHLRPLGRRWRVHAVPARDRRLHRRHLRRLPRRRRRRRAGLRRRRPPPGRHPRRHRVVRLPRRLPVAACSRPSAATATTRSTRRPRRRSSARSSPAEPRAVSRPVPPPASPPRPSG